MNTPARTKNINTKYKSNVKNMLNYLCVKFRYCLLHSTVYCVVLCNGKNWVYLLILNTGDYIKHRGLY